MSRVEVLSVSTSQLAYMLDGRQPSSGSISSARPKFSNCKLSGPMAGSAAASKQILKLGVILAWLGCVGHNERHGALSATCCD
jgi:hypothetical protein